MSFFSKWFSKKKGSSVHECPKKGDICVYVFRVDNEQAVSGVKVSISGTSSGQKSTDGNGYAEFPDRDPGPYEFKIALPKNLSHYKIDPYYQSLSLDAGGHATGDVGVYPTGKLNVQVYNDLNPPKLVTDPVTVSVSGPAIDGELTRSGTHLFPELMCGTYEVKAKGPAASYDPFEGIASNVVVPDGGTGNARIVLKLINDVTPTITADEREIWFMEPPTEAEKTEATAQGGEPYTRESQPVHLRVTYTETRPEKPYTDAGTLQFSGADVDVFVDQGCKTPFALDGARSARINNSRLKSGVDLYVRGKAEGQLTATLTLDPPADASIRARGPAQQALEVKPENVVTPKIEVEYKVVLADPDLARHQDATKSDGTTKEEKILSDNVTYIEVSALARRGTPQYTKGGKLEVTSGADKVKVYTDMRRTKALDRPLTNAELFGARPFILYVESVKDKEGEFKLKLTLDPSGDPHIQVQPMKEVEMAVVKLDLKLHQHKDAIVDEEFDADKDTLDAYFTALKDKVIPDQEVMTDEKQVKPGRLLHVQKDGHHGRAKLLLKKLTGWPGGTDDYEVIVNQECDSGAISLWDKETEGTQKDLPFKIKVSELKKADVEFWVEGTTTTKLWRDVVLSAGIDREEGGLAKEPKHNGDWARFTVVQVKEVKLDYTPASGQPNAWNATDNQFYVNYKAGLDGRKIKLKVELSEKLKDIPLHFMLAPHKDNGKTANLGVDLPATWKWKDIAVDEAKHKDRSAEKKLLHLSKKSDADGKAELEIHLSRIGGQVFEPGIYITQDPHLAKYVKDHADLGKRKPVVAAHTITVWRRFAYQKVTVTGRAYPATTPSEDVYKRVKATMLERPAKNYSQAEVRGMALPALYPEYNFKVGAGNDIVLNVCDANTGQFFAAITADAEHPIKIPVITCDYNWGEEQDSAVAVGLNNIVPSSFPLEYQTNVHVCDPPLQGGNLLVSGDWDAEDWDGTAWVNFRSGSFADGEVTVDAGRNHLNKISIALPAALAGATDDTAINITNLVVQGAGDHFLGGYNIDGNQRIVCVYDPSDAQDYQNTVVHEIGHAFHQTLGTPPATGVPVNPNYILNRTGPHCTYSTNKCVMFTSGPIAGSLNRYCPDCHPHLLVQDMQSIA